MMSEVDSEPFIGGGGGGRGEGGVNGSACFKIRFNRYIRNEL